MDWRTVALGLVFLVAGGIGVWAVWMWWGTGTAGLEYAAEIETWPVVQARVVSVEDRKVEETVIDRERGRATTPTERWLTVERIDGVEPARLHLRGSRRASPGDVIDIRVDPNHPSRAAADSAAKRNLYRGTSWLYRGAAVLMGALMLGTVLLFAVIKVADWRNGRIWQDGGTALVLEDRSLSEVEVDAEQMEGVERVVLRNNAMTEVPTALLVPTLRSADLSWNRLESVPPELAGLTALTELRLSGNPLGAVPPEVLELHGLRELRLERTGLTELPVEVGDLRQLEVLDLRGNELTALPASINRLTELRLLFLSGNPAMELPPLDDLRQLERLILPEDTPDGVVEALQAAHPEAEVRTSAF